MSLSCASCKRSLVIAVEKRDVLCNRNSSFGDPLFLRQYVEVACVMVLHGRCNRFC